MHDLRMVREHVDTLREGMRRRAKLQALAPAIDRARAADEERRGLIQAVEERKAARNAMSHQVARLKKAGEDAGDLLAQARDVGDEIGKLESELSLLQTELTS